MPYLIYMRNYFIIIIFCTCLNLSACKKNINTPDCYQDRQTTQQITDKPATIKESANAGVYFIIPQGTYDQQLRPCNLPDEFKVNNLPVIVSGLVKLTLQVGPCCIEDFIITKISK